MAGDFLDVARDILTSLHETIAIEEIPAPENAGEDWLLRVMREEDERQNEEGQKSKCKVMID